MFFLDEDFRRIDKYESALVIFSDCLLQIFHASSQVMCLRQDLTTFTQPSSALRVAPNAKCFREKGDAETIDLRNTSVL